MTSLTLEKGVVQLSISRTMTQGKPAVVKIGPSEITMYPIPDADADADTVLFLSPLMLRSANDAVSVAASGTSSDTLTVAEVVKGLGFRAREGGDFRVENGLCLKVGDVWQVLPVDASRPAEVYLTAPEGLSCLRVICETAFESTLDVFQNGEGSKAHRLNSYPLAAGTAYEVISGQGNKPERDVRLVFSSQSGLIQLTGIEFATLQSTVGARVNPMPKVLGYDSLKAPNITSNSKNTSVPMGVALPWEFEATSPDGQVILSNLKFLNSRRALLRMVMSHDTEGKLVQLYTRRKWDGGFSEDESLVHRAGPRGEMIEYLIPFSTHGLHSLRLDPIDGKGQVKVDDLSIWSVPPDGSERRSALTKEDLLELVSDRILSQGGVSLTDEGLRVKVAANLRQDWLLETHRLPRSARKAVLHYRSEYEVVLNLYGVTMGAGQKVLLGSKLLLPGLNKKEELPFQVGLMDAFILQLAPARGDAILFVDQLELTT